ncbi:hypothetical protein QBC35DRAFT_255843 [Podospora australis]|uniref:Uncharacterized protein n=1 Tax=Podospora australis TaxID=1536484 RepID=A0AAN6WQY4_9PEZI|nr:hypothetical protein QBC35DRAFT_255843 [Podospora australis]
MCSQGSLLRRSSKSLSAPRAQYRANGDYPELRDPPVWRQEPPLILRAGTRPRPGIEEGTTGHTQPHSEQNDYRPSSRLGRDPLPDNIFSASEYHAPEYSFHAAKASTRPGVMETITEYSEDEEEAISQIAKTQAYDQIQAPVPAPKPSCSSIDTKRAATSRRQDPPSTESLSPMEMQVDDGLTMEAYVQTMDLMKHGQLSSASTGSLSMSVSPRIPMRTANKQGSMGSIASILSQGSGIGSSITNKSSITNSRAKIEAQIPPLSSHNKPLLPEIDTSSPFASFNTYACPTHPNTANASKDNKLASLWVRAPESPFEKVRHFLREDRSPKGAVGGSPLADENMVSNNVLEEGKLHTFIPAALDPSIPALDIDYDRSKARLDGGRFQGDDDEDVPEETSDPPSATSSLTVTSQADAANQSDQEDDTPPMDDLVANIRRWHIEESLISQIFKSSVGPVTGLVGTRCRIPKPSRLALARMRDPLAAFGYEVERYCHEYWAGYDMSPVIRGYRELRGSLDTSGKASTRANGDRDSGIEMDEQRSPCQCRELDKSCSHAGCSKDSSPRGQYYQRLRLPQELQLPLLDIESGVAVALERISIPGDADGCPTPERTESASSASSSRPQPMKICTQKQDSRISTYQTNNSSCPRLPTLDLSPEPVVSGNLESTRRSSSTMATATDAFTTATILPKTPPLPLTEDEETTLMGAVNFVTTQLTHLRDYLVDMDITTNFISNTSPWDSYAPLRQAAVRKLHDEQSPQLVDFADKTIEVLRENTAIIAALLDDHLPPELVAAADRAKTCAASTVMTCAIGIASPSSAATSEPGSSSAMADSGHVTESSSSHPSSSSSHPSSSPQLSSGSSSSTRIRKRKGSYARRLLGGSRKHSSGVSAKRIRAPIRLAYIRTGFWGAQKLQRFPIFDRVTERTLASIEAQLEKVTGSSGQEGFVGGYSDDDDKSLVLGIGDGPDSGLYSAMKYGVSGMARDIHDRRNGVRRYQQKKSGTPSVKSSDCGSRQMQGDPTTTGRQSPSRRPAAGKPPRWVERFLRIPRSHKHKFQKEEGCITSGTNCLGRVEKGKAAPMMMVPTPTTEMTMVEALDHPSRQDLRLRRKSSHRRLLSVVAAQEQQQEREAQAPRPRGIPPLQPLGFGGPGSVLKPKNTFGNLRDGCQGQWQAGEEEVEDWKTNG